MPQAFKGCLKALDAAQAMAAGVKLAAPDAAVHVVPMADGGDDTLDVLMVVAGGRRHSSEVVGPDGRSVKAEWGVLKDGETAVIEMAQASGLGLLTPAQRDPRVTTTFGTGQLVLAALEAGYRNLLVGVGGSATVDGGTGALSALGVRFLDARGWPLPPGGAALADLASIDTSGIDPRLRESSIRVACDVDMPLCGPGGAWKFSAQKGATPEVARELDRALEHYGKVVLDTVGIDIRNMPLAGPAGGLSGGLHALLGAKLERGAELVLEATGWARRLEEADLIIVGEGGINDTTFRGKGPGTIANLARMHGIPVVAVVGQIADDAPDLASEGIAGVRTLMSYVGTEAEACARARELIARASQEAVQEWLPRLQGNAR